MKKGTTRVEVKKETQAKTPLEKGASSGSAASSAAPGKPVPHVMVDYHNVLSIQNGITPERSAAMVKLLDAGVKVTVCSWCFPKRAKQVMAAMKTAWIRKTLLRHAMFSSHWLFCFPHFST